MEPLNHYRGREPTAVKHAVLKRYLQRLAYKVGSWCNTLNYVEGFAGPWKTKTEDLSDTSPHIAIGELRAARDGLERIGRVPKIRCLFVEKGKRAAATLLDSMQRYSDIHVKVLQGEFVEKIPDIVEFASIPSQAFTFIFVDPTGWTGFDPDEIAPLLKAGNTEVLITFMTKDIIRFIDHNDGKIRRSFNPLFGSEEQRRAWEGLERRAREDAIVDAFCRRVREVGGYKYVVSAIVLHPTRNRTHFHLIYGTRSIEGLRTFRKVEHDTIGAQKSAREAAKQRERVQRTRQEELFPVGAVESISYLEQLQSQHHEAARQALSALLQSGETVPFESLEEAALLYPMTSTDDLKAWLKDWKDKGLVRSVGMAPRERTLKPGKGHHIMWLGRD